jgi:lipopolysaccharide cholinephosphotransferase
MILSNNDLRRLQLKQLDILDQIVKICKEENITYFFVGGTLLGAVRHKGFIPWDDDIDIGMPRKDYDRFLSICEEKLGDNYIVACILNNKYHWLPFTKIMLKNTIYKESYKGNIKYNGPVGIWVDIFPLDNAKKQLSIFNSIRAFLVRIFKIILFKKNNFEGFNKFLAKIVIFLAKPFSKKTIQILLDNSMKIGKDHDEYKYFISLGSTYNYKKETILKEKYLPVKELQFEGKIYNAPNDYDYILKRIYGDYMKLPPLEERVNHNPIEIDFGD